MIQFWMDLEEGASGLADGSDLSVCLCACVWGEVSRMISGVSSHW